MTRYEFVRQYADILKQCEGAGVSVEDWRGAQIFEEVMRLKNDGLKMEYCVAYASEKFSISEARVWRIVRHMKRSI